MTPSPTQSNVLTQLRSFLLSVLPAGFDVLAAQQNQIPEPKGPDFVLMTPIRQQRLGTNFDSYEDAVFTGSISGATMTISTVDPRFSGKLSVGSTVFGVGVADSTTVTALGTGTGGTGTYTVDPPQTVASETLSAGTETLTQSMRYIVQLDFHSASYDAGDMAAVVSTVMRDAVAVDQFANQSPNYGVVPLYADDARQVPFVNDQQQYEWRWVVMAELQVNVAVRVPRQFAGALSVQIIDVDAAYPP